MIYVFGEYEFDEHLYELRRSGESVKIEPKVFDVLAYLIHHRNRVVTKAELIEKLWPGEYITESALVRCVVSARKAVQDDGVRQQVIKTLRGRGYRFIAAIKEHRPTRDSDLSPTVSPARFSQATPAADEISGSVFVGRQREVRELRANLEQALIGRGRLVLLVGEPGIGKTRTADELAHYARQRQAQVLVGHCYKGEGAPAFWPWVQIIRAYMRERDPTELMALMGIGAADIAEVVPEVRQLLPGLPRPPALEPEQARFRFFDSITTFLKHVAQERPLVLILDDLHWADKPSLLLLQFLAREMRHVCLLIVGTYSDVGLGRQHPLTQTLGELVREEIGQRIPLRGLNQRDVMRFIECVTGSPPCEALVSMVYRKTEGNPFFIKEIVRLLASDGSLQRQAEGTSWHLTIPQEVREVIDRRLAHLSEPCNRVLSVASVIGREFSLDVLEHLSNLSADRLLEVLEEAIAAHIVDELPRTVGRYSFSHALIHETLYDELTTTRRVRVHRRIGEILEQLYATNLEPHLDELAYHFFQAAPAGVLDKAIAYAARAGEHATSLLAYEDAAGHYGRALQAIERQETPDQQQRLTLLLALGEAQLKAGDTRQAQTTLKQADALKKQLAAARAQASEPHDPAAGSQPEHLPPGRRHSRTGSRSPVDSRRRHRARRPSRDTTHRAGRPPANTTRKHPPRRPIRRHSSRTER
jgi:predicted ATPase